MRTATRQPCHKKQFPPRQQPGLTGLWHLGEPIETTHGPLVVGVRATRRGGLEYLGWHWHFGDEPDISSTVCLQRSSCDTILRAFCAAMDAGRNSTEYRLRCGRSRTDPDEWRYPLENLLGSAKGWGEMAAYARMYSGFLCTVVRISPDDSRSIRMEFRVAELGQIVQLAGEAYDFLGWDLPREVVRCDIGRPARIKELP